MVCRHPKRNLCNWDNHLTLQKYYAQVMFYTCSFSHYLRLLSIFLIALTSCVTESDENIGVGVGDSVPTFEVTLDDGETVTNNSLRGRVGVIVFFSTTCGDCRRELPQVETVYRHFEEDDDVLIFAVSREEKPGAVETFWNELGLTFLYSAQNDRAVYNLFATIGVPRIYITDKRGIIVKIYDDSRAFDSQELIDTIDYYK